MIISSQTRNDTPLVSVIIDGVPVDYVSIGKIELELSENKHDLATVYFTGLSPSLVLEYVNRPIHITIGSGPRDLTGFFGYISYLEPTNKTNRGAINGSFFQETKAYCFGASYDMREKRTHVWENVTLPQLVESIASKYRFTYEVPDTDLVFPRIVQRGESDWKVLVNTAARIGYVVTAHGPHLDIYDPLRSLAAYTQYVTLQNMIGSEGDIANQPGRILTFRGTFGSDSPVGNSSTHSVEFMDHSGTPDSLSVERQASGFGEQYPARYDNTITTTAETVAMAEAVAGAHARKKMPFNAVVESRGVATPYPGSVVYVDHYESKFDGFWLVRQVKHTVIRSTFLTELHISRDATTDDLIALRPPRGPYHIPDPVLIRGRWVAAQEYSHVY